MPGKGSVLRGIAAAVVLGSAAATSAVAQTTPYPYPVCSGKSPTNEDVAAAKKTFELANRYLSEADYERAIAYYRDAYRSDCTAHKLLGYIARAYELRGDRGEAVRALETYLERAPHGDDRVVVEKRIANLRAQIAREALAPRDAGTDASDAGMVEAGPAVVDAAVVRAAPVEPLEERSLFSPIVPVAIAGTGVAVMLAGGIATAVGGGNAGFVERGCSGRVCPTDDEVARGNAGRSTQIAGHVVMGVGAAMTVGGALWWLLARSGGEASASGRVGASPVVGPGYAGASVGGSF